MSYIDNQVQNITEILLEVGCGIYHPTSEKIRGILCETIIAANLDSSLAADAIDYLNREENDTTGKN